MAKFRGGQSGEGQPTPINSEDLPPIDDDDFEDIDDVQPGPAPTPAPSSDPLDWIAPEKGRLVEQIGKVEGRVARVERELADVIQDGVEAIVVSQDEAERLRRLNAASAPRVNAAVAAVLGTPPSPPVPPAADTQVAPSGDPPADSVPVDQPAPVPVVTDPLPVVTTTTDTVTVAQDQPSNDGDRLFKSVFTILAVFLLLTFVVVPLVRWAGEEVIKQWQGNEGRKVRVHPNSDDEMTWMFWVSLGVAIFAGWKAWVNNRLPVFERVYQRSVRREVNTGA